MIMNPLLKNMSIQELKEFSAKCNESNEFFYENYIRKMPANSNLPPYSENNYRHYMITAKKKRDSLNTTSAFLKANSIMSYPLTTEEALKKKR